MSGHNRKPVILLKNSLKPGTIAITLFRRNYKNKTTGDFSSSLSLSVSVSVSVSVAVSVSVGVSVSVSVSVSVAKHKQDKW